ncbi:MAG: carbohydrate ABC transporter substrate-binding protein, partial [Gammaproteobacteria bacterium]|nr:carbohydrate ABC transporter substrate-binding protein [Gammaproteobacteria bacterium]
PDYPKLAQLWWQYISQAASGEATPQEALNGLAEAQDKVMERLERANVQPLCGPKMNTPRDEAYWLAQPGSPKPKLANEKPQGVPVSYDDLLRSWE